MAAFSGPEIPNSGLIFNLDAKNEGKTYGLTSVEVLVVAGGGGGGTRHGGGGGGGGVIYNSAYTVSPGSGVTVTIGQGGAGATAGSSNVGTAGQNSVFGSLTAIGGGYGSSDSTGGGAGGSGGGARGNSATPGGAGTTGQGFAGGNGALQDTFNVEGMGGGGGGARTPGAPGSLIRGLRGVGGAGVPSLITGSITHYGGGGGAGGAGLTSPAGGAVGGIGGGGQGNVGSGSGGDTSTAGTPNTGGGGGAGGHDDGTTNFAGKQGGSGVVIIRYQGPQQATGGTVTRAGNYTVHTFTSSGTFTSLSSSSINGIGDLSQNTFVTAVNSPTYSSGYFSLNGSNQYFTTPMSTLRPSSITLECWFYQNSTSGDQVLIGAQYGTSSNNSYALWKNGNSWYGGVNIGGSFTYLTASYTASANTWYHYVYSYNGSTEKLFINGTEVLSGSRSGSISYDTSNTLLAIGGDWNGAGYDSGINVFLNGRLGTVRIYNRGLTASEVNNLYQASRDRYGI